MLHDVKTQNVVLQARDTSLIRIPRTVDPLFLIGASNVASFILIIDSRHDNHPIVGHQIQETQITRDILIFKQNLLEAEHIVDWSKQLLVGRYFIGWFDGWRGLVSLGSLQPLFNLDVVLVFEAETVVLSECLFPAHGVFGWQEFKFYICTNAHFTDWGMGNNWNGIAIC